MLVIFSCDVYADTTYFGDVAQGLLKMMGHIGNVPGAIFAGQVGQSVEDCRVDPRAGDNSAVVVDDGDTLGTILVELAKEVLENWRESVEAHLDDQH